MIYLILDTNIWIYLANGFNSITNQLDPSSQMHFELYEKLKQKTDDKEFVILTNYIIRLEWERNKKAAYANIAKLEEMKKQEISALVGRKNRLGEQLFKEECRKTNDTFNQAIALNKQHIENIENFMKSCVEVPVSDELKLELAERAISKDKAPFLYDKNNFADAAILLSAAEYLRLNMEPISHAVFVSNNHKEFGNSIGSNDFHNDLKKYLTGINIDYHKHLNNLLELTEELEYAIEAFHEHQRGQDYYFECLSAFCETKDGYEAFGYYKNKVRIASTAEQDADQLNLFEGHDLHKIDSGYVLEGSCMRCSINHVQCPCCSKLLIDMNGDESYFCDLCEKIFKTVLSKENKDKIIYQIDESELHL